MKILAVGDIHGNNAWKKIDFGKYDKVISVGDIFDSKIFNTREIKQNAIDFYGAKIDNLVRLMGNHELHYFKKVSPKYSGFRADMLDDYYDILHSYYDGKEIKFVDFYDGVVYSHAGLMSAFYHLVVNRSSTMVAPAVVNDKVVELINHVLNRNFDMLYISSTSRGGKQHFGSVVWADYSDLIFDPRPIPYKQVFGHSASSGGSKHIRPNGNWLLNIDSFQWFDYVYEITDGEMTNVFQIN